MTRLYIGDGSDEFGVGGRTATTPFSPFDLFANGEKGAWYDPSDLSTLYQDALGLTPVTAHNDPVGLILDKSQWGGKTLEQFLAGQPELFDPEFVPDISNTGSTSVGAYDTETNEFSTTQAGTLNYRPTFRILPIDAGKYYRVRLKFTGNLDPIFAVTMTSASSGDNHGTGGVAGAHIRNNGGLLEFIGGRFGFGSSPNLTLWTDGQTTWDGLFIDVDECSLKEIPGDHAYQETTAARPIYQTDGTTHWLLDDGADDSLNADLPADTYTRAYVDREGNVTFEESVAISGSENILRNPELAGALYINRILTSDEKAQLSAWWAS